MFKDFNGTLIILVRHGECEENIKGMFRGRTDFPLNERGLIQAQDLARELKNFPLKYIYTSPLSRARQTAEAIGQECGIEVKVEEQFNNIASPYFWKIHLDTASYSLLSYKENRGYCLIQLNQTKHLKEYFSEWV